MSMYVELKNTIKNIYYYTLPPLSLCNFYSLDFRCALDNGLKFLIC